MARAGLRKSASICGRTLYNAPGGIPHVCALSTILILPVTQRGACVALTLSSCHYALSMAIARILSAPPTRRIASWAGPAVCAGAVSKPRHARAAQSVARTYDIVFSTDWARFSAHDAVIPIKTVIAVDPCPIAKGWVTIALAERGDRSAFIVEALTITAANETLEGSACLRAILSKVVGCTFAGAVAEGSIIACTVAVARYHSWT